MLFLFFIVVFVRPITVLLHELGHGLTALLVTRGKVSLFLGSYGDRGKGYRFGFGRLELYISKGIYYQGAGLCIVESTNLSIARRMAYIAMGPGASLVAAVLFFALGTSTWVNEDIARMAIFCFLSASLDLVINLVPRKAPITLHDGGKTYNDGRLLLMLWSRRWEEEAYSIAVEHYNAGEFAEAATLFHGVVRKEKRVREPYRLAISSYLQVRNFANARMLLQEMAEQWPLEADELMSYAYMKIQENDLNGAIADLDRILELRPSDAWALSNRGFVHELLGAYDMSMADLDQAIAADPQHSYAYNNRGLTLIRLGRMQEGLDNILKAFELDGKHSYMHRNLGIYHFEMGHYAEALPHFVRAAELDNNTLLNAEYLERTKQHLEPMGHRP